MANPVLGAEVGSSSHDAERRATLHCTEKKRDEKWAVILKHFCGWLPKGVGKHKRAVSRCLLNKHLRSPLGNDRRNNDRPRAPGLPLRNVSAIGSAESHKAVLENPDMISKTVLSRRLDAETAFEIVSIDIADIDVGMNIGARLRADQAEADTQVARARSEGRRAEAVATEQENKAEIERSRAKLVEAESQVPLSIAEALESGSVGIMDLYKLRNLQADTEMRKGIAKTGSQAG